MGVRCTAIGHCCTAPGESYPSRLPAHPPDHDFTWRQGRILQDLQIVHISAGAGFLEYDKKGMCRIEADTLFLVPPRTWHRYRPDPEIGWTEQWLELKGTVTEDALSEYRIFLQKPFLSIDEIPEISELFFKCHCLAETRAWGFEEQMGLSGLEILLLAFRAISFPPLQGSRASSTEEEVRKLQRKLLSVSREPTKLRRLLKDSSLSEVHFRRLFKRRTGLSPKQYLMQIRLRQTMDLLRQTRLSLAKIAERLGYDSAYHLSQDFKKRMGTSPDSWRKSVWRLKGK